MQSLTGETIRLVSFASCAPDIANFAVRADSIVEIVIHACTARRIRVSVFALAAQAIGFTFYTRRALVVALRAVCLSVIVITEVTNTVSTLVQSMNARHTFVFLEIKIIKFVLFFVVVGGCNCFKRSL